MSAGDFLSRKALDALRVAPGKPAGLARRETAWQGNGKSRKPDRRELKKRAQAYLEERRNQLAEAQELLYADDRYALLMIFQALDAAGKDGTIKHVLTGVNPAGCQVFSFKAPSSEELDHDFLWRAERALPERGRIGVFNRSYYEEVLVVRVHPEFLQRQRLPAQRFDAAFWEGRYQSINEFERHLVRNGTVVLKFFLHVSKEEQRRRFLDRLNDPAKNWKFSYGDLEESRRWDDYMAAFEAALTKTSTEWAPWHVIPADNKWVMRALVSHIIADRLKALDLRFPKPDAEKEAAIQKALQELTAEEETQAEAADETAEEAAR